MVTRWARNPVTDDITAMQHQEDARTFFKHRQPQLVAAGVYLLALVAWLEILTRWMRMPAADAHPASMAHPGVPETLAVAGGVRGWLLYLAMWGTMMVAMMYPSSVPLLRLYSTTLDGVATRGKLLRVAAFLGTYTLVWTATGLIPLLVTRTVSLHGLAVTHGEVLLGGVLLLLGSYQLSPYKYRCLKRCRSPLGFLMQSHRPGLRGAVHMSFRHSIYCVGCCWALFTFMVVVGSMNIVWMAIITVVLSLERTVAWGEWLASAVGILAGVAGIGLIIVTVM